MSTAYRGAAAIPRDDPGHQPKAPLGWPGGEALLPVSAHGYPRLPQVGKLGGVKPLDARISTDLRRRVRGDTPKPREHYFRFR